MDARAELTAVIAQELAQPVPAAVRAMAEAVRARHAEAALGVLFYGSCLRKPESLLADSLLDFYLLVDDYRAGLSRRTDGVRQPACCRRTCSIWRRSTKARPCAANMR